MARQAINTGSVLNDPTAENIRSGFTKTNANFTELYARADAAEADIDGVEADVVTLQTAVSGLDNRVDVLEAAGPSGPLGSPGSGPWLMDLIADFGAVGDSNYSVGGGADDSDAIEAWLAALKTGAGCGKGVVPGNHTYRFTRTITIPRGVTIEGSGGFDGSQETPPTFVWDGDDDGIGFEIETPNENIFTTAIKNICVTSKASGNQLGTAFRFTATGGAAGKLDSGTLFDGVWIILTSSHAIDIQTNGATNFVWRGGRFDSIGGYAMHVALGGSGKQFIMRAENMTYQGGTGGQGKGLLWLDGDAATANGDGLSTVTIDGLHTECNQDLDTTYASGSNPYDKAGLFRLGVKPSLTTLQHHLKISGWHHSFPGGIKSHSAILVTATSGTAADASDKVAIHVQQGHTLSSTDTGDAGSANEVRLVGGLFPTERSWPWDNCGNVAEYRFGVGPDNNPGGVRAYAHHRDGADGHRGIGLRASTVSQLDAFPIGPVLRYVTDATSTTLGSTVAGGGSNKVLVFYNASAWKIFAVVN